MGFSKESRRFKMFKGVNHWDKCYLLIFNKYNKFNLIIFNRYFFFIK